MAIESEPLVVPAIFFSDLSIVEEGTRKRSLLGCFDQFTFPQFPAVYQRFFVTIWITNLEGNLDEMDLTVRIEQKDSAHVVYSSSMKVSLGAMQRFARDNILAFSMAIPTVNFPIPGVHTALVLLNGDEVGKRDFSVLQVAQQ